jgi:hypothetical protein
MRLAIGDIHGRNFWKHYLNEDFTEYYIVGDYFDSFDIPYKIQMINFQEITNTARQNKRIKLCLGNHDYHYLINKYHERYSGFQKEHAVSIQKIVSDNLDLFQIIYATDDNILISHAGVSKTFMRINNIKEPLEINERFNRNMNLVAFSGRDPSGDDITQGPLWIRPHSLAHDFLNGYSQIIGHTPARTIRTLELPDRNSAERKMITITIIDTHDCETIYRF